jgi:hypothetical protein
MRSGVRTTQAIFAAILTFTAACGGGGGTGGVQASPPMPDFSMAVSSVSVSVSQGATSAPVDVSVSAQNGFTSDVEVSFTGLPSGVTSNPASPFSLTAGQRVSVLFGAGQNAATGQFTLTAQGTSGTLSHSKSLSLSIQAPVLTNLPQTSFVENDSVPLVDTPAGEPHRRHVVYDSANQRFYVANGATQALLLDANLNLLGSYSSLGPAGLVFSRDGQSLYVDEPYGNSSVVSVLSTSAMQSVGQIPDIPIQGVPTSIQEVCESSNLIGLNNCGVAFLDGSKPVALPQPAPVLSTVPTAQPAEGAAAGGTTISLSGTNFGSSPQVRFGTGSPVNAASSSGSQIQVSSPANALSGPVNLTAYFSNGWLALAPSAFSYGPTVVSILPNAGKPQGGDSVTVLGYGFGTNAGSVTVTIGGNAASVQNVQALPGFAAALGLDSTYPFALEQITLITPAGSAGKADLTIQSPAGSATVTKAFQYVASSQTYTNPGLHKFIAYDPSRQRLFLTAIDHVDVFDLKALAFVSPIEPPPNGPPPDAGLRGVALTPDFSQLIVADFGAQSVYLINPDGAAYNGTAVSVGGVAGFSSSGPARVAATSAQTVFVGLSGEGGTGACNNCLGQMNILASPPVFQPVPQPEVSALTGTPLLQADAAGDVAFLAYDTSPGGPVALWNAATPNIFLFRRRTTQLRILRPQATEPFSPCVRQHHRNSRIESDAGFYSHNGGIGEYSQPHSRSRNRITSDGCADLRTLSRWSPTQRPTSHGNSWRH